MAKTLLEARQEGEARIGRRLTDQEYADALEYAERKSDMTGHDRSYVLLLLPDVIYEQEYSRWSLEHYRAVKEAEKELEEWIKQHLPESDRLSSNRWSFIGTAPAV